MLRVVTSADLGGLGDQAGTPVEYDWALPGAAPLLLPWLMILGLLGMKRNRHASAWWILAPLGLAFGAGQLSSVFPAGADFFADIIIALLFGLAAIWLTADYLRRSHWMLTWLCVMPALGGFSLLVFLSSYGLGLHDSSVWQIAIVLLIAVSVCATALTLVSRICKHNFRSFACSLWLLLIMAALWLLIALPFFLLAQFSSGGNLPWSEFFVPVLCVGLGNYAVLLPFLILSGANTLYLKRLKHLLNIDPPLLSAPETNINFKHQPS